jgi:hypothetical protein
MSATILSLESVRSKLDRLAVFKTLINFDPRWVGSIPLNIHGPDADADICCSGGDLTAFRRSIDQAFSHLPGFSLSPNTHAGEASIIAKFNFESLPVEIYGRARPVEAHESYIHWLAGDRLLRLAEPRFRDDVRTAKLTGLKTEPAFAKCLKLGGDPYIELLKLASPGDDALRAIIRSAGYSTPTA